jgi:hypothetical protein
MERTERAYSPGGKIFAKHGYVWPHGLVTRLIRNGLKILTVSDGAIEVEGCFQSIRAAIGDDHAAVHYWERNTPSWSQPTL